jgi:hypothetical protein
MRSLIPEAKKYVIRHKLHYVGAACFAWDMLGDMASLRGQPCTATVSPCLINGECRRLTWPRHALWRIYTKS